MTSESASPGSLGVAMLLGWNGVGGAQRQALRLSAELRLLGVEPFVITRLGSGLPPHENVDGVHVYRVGRARPGVGLSLTFLGGALLWMLRHRRAFDVVHAHNLPMALTAALLRPLVRKPLIVKLPNAVSIDGFARRRLGTLRWVVLRRHVARWVALNEEIERRLTGRGIPARRIVRIPNGVDTPDGPTVGGASRRVDLGVKPDTRIGLYLGRLVPDKGVAWLLEAWQDVVRQDAGCHLLVVGDGPDEPRLQALSHQLGLTGAVSFLGYRSDVERFLSIADFLVLPSRSEGMSNAVLEGMAHGLAVVATDVPGNRAVVADGRDGILVAHGDRRALTGALLGLASDPVLRDRLGRAAARKAQSTFSMSAIAAAYDRLYRQVAAGGAA
jgi:glycosyltransferase involved in cell wall biosynthesis